MRHIVLGNDIFFSPTKMYWFRVTSLVRVVWYTLYNSLKITKINLANTTKLLVWYRRTVFFFFSLSTIGLWHTATIRIFRIFNMTHNMTTIFMIFKNLFWNTFNIFTQMLAPYHLHYMSTEPFSYGYYLRCVSPIWFNLDVTDNKIQYKLKYAYF